MVSQTRSMTRSRSRRGRFSILEDEGRSSSEEETKRPTTPDAKKTSTTKKRKADGSPDNGPDSPKIKRGRPSVEKPIGKKPKVEPESEGPQLEARDPEYNIPWKSWPICKMKPRNNRNTFRRGYVIRLPIPQPNTDPTLKETDRKAWDLFPTRYGGVYSKRRMAIVLYRFQTLMMVLPLYSWGGKGISSQLTSTHVDLVEICNQSELSGYKKEGVNEVIGVEMNRGSKLEKSGCVSLAGAFAVDYREDIEFVGTMSMTSQRSLNNTMVKFMSKAFRDA